MNPDEYRAALERAKHKDSLEHGEQGSEWKNHKYIRKIGNRYIYKEDLARSNTTIQNNREHFNAVAKAAGDKKSVIKNDNDAFRAQENLKSVMDESKSEAAKGYANDLTDALEETGTYWLKGFNSEIDIDDYLDKLVEKKGTELDRDGKAEVVKMAVTQFIRRIDKELADNEKRDNPTSYDPERLKEWNEARGKLMSEFNTNTPYADRKSEIEDFEDKVKNKSKLRHSFESREEFYAAVEKSKNELAHFGIKNQRWGFRRFQNRDGTLTEAGKERYRDSNVEAAKGLKSMVFKQTNFNSSNRKVAYNEGVKAVGSALLSAALVATAARNGKNIVSNVKNKKYFKAAFDATKLAGKVFVGAQLVAKSIGHVKNAGMALSVDKMKNDKDAAEARKSAYQYKEANAKANASSSRADAQWTKTKESYNALGSGAFAGFKRARAARKNESPAAQEYNANRSKAVDLSAKAKIDRSRADDIRKKMGKNRVERDYNMAKYGR
ncbi:MAG: hypothetical protein J6Y02_13510 [Pseudobutyrivibrio sp.]|nr:hypothetical protein [Pseudobutyrivibrio sp.]